MRPPRHFLPAPVSSFGAKNLIKSRRQQPMTARRVFGCGEFDIKALGFKNYTLEKFTAKTPKVMEVWPS